MGENKGKGDEKEKKPVENQKEKEKKGGGAAEKKEEGTPKFVFTVDMHCEGCASKIKRCVKGFEGVKRVMTDAESNKLTVIGTVDPWKLREHVEAKTRKKVEIVSPANPPKKEADGGGKKPQAAADGKKSADGDKKPAAAGGSKEKKKPDDKKSKEAAASSTVVLKIRLHCDGCIQRIKKTILKIKGVQDVSVDAQKDLVTVKGTMDATSLPHYLKEKLNRGVEIISATTGGGGEKKEKPAAAPNGGGGGGAAEKKDKGGAGGGGGGEKKGKDGGGGGKKEEATVSAAAVEANKMDYYGGGPYGYSAQMLHAPQLFSDENPNACSVM